MAVQVLFGNSAWVGVRTIDSIIFRPAHISVVTRIGFRTVLTSTVSIFIKILSVIKRKKQRSENPVRKTHDINQINNYSTLIHKDKQKHTQHTHLPVGHVASNIRQH